MNKKIKNKRAFTLAELLVVVIVIGVLSAVAFPKFNQIIENRKVTEAEEMMSAVRTEQEHRCAMDKKYTLKLDNLSDIISSGKTKDYNYSLQAEGISAQSNKGDYTLKMLSYQDGTFCCTGEGCAKLNKNYPKCEGLTFPPSNCVGDDGTVEVGPDPEVPTPECTDGQTRGSQVCNTCGTQTTQACVGGKWVAQLGPCSKTVEECTPKCEGPQPADEEKECECGTVKASYTCSAATNYKWVLGNFPPCPPKPKDITEFCSDGTKRKRTVSCVNGVWLLGNWDRECPTEEQRYDCCVLTRHTYTYMWGGSYPCPTSYPKSTADHTYYFNQDAISKWGEVSSSSQNCPTNLSEGTFWAGRHEGWSCVTSSSFHDYTHNEINQCRERGTVYRLVCKKKMASLGQPYKCLQKEISKW